MDPLVLQKSIPPDGFLQNTLDQPFWLIKTNRGVDKLIERGFVYIYIYTVHNGYSDNLDKNSVSPPLSLYPLCTYKEQESRRGDTLAM